MYERLRNGTVGGTSAPGRAVGGGGWVCGEGGGSEGGGGGGGWGKGGAVAATATSRAAQSVPMAATEAGDNGTTENADEDTHDMLMVRPNSSTHRMLMMFC